MYSSHSGTPVPGSFDNFVVSAAVELEAVVVDEFAADVVVFDVTTAVFFAAVLAVALLVAAPPQPMNIIMTPRQSAAVKMVIVFIKCFPLKVLSCRLAYP